MSMTKKNCNKCKELKPLTEFSKAKAFNDGLRYQCKYCDKVDKMSYSHTKIGLIKNIYLNQKYCSIQRKHPSPNYSLHELIKWINNQVNFDLLYLNWINSGYNRNKIPSCDRLNDYLPYSLDNLQLLTWKENNDKYYKDVLSGINNKRNRPVIQMSLSGEFIKKHYSIANAKRITGATHIYGCCNGKRNHSKGFKWKYA